MANVNSNQILVGIPPFSAPIVPITVNLGDTNDTQILHVPYAQGNKTARFYITKIRVTNRVTGATPTVVKFSDDDLNADAAIRTAGRVGDNSADPLFIVQLAENDGTNNVDETMKELVFEPGTFLHLGLTALSTASTDVDVTVWGYMSY